MVRSNIFIFHNGTGYSVQYQDSSMISSVAATYLNRDKKSYYSAAGVSFSDAVASLFNIPEKVYAPGTFLKLHAHKKTPVKKEDVAVLRHTVDGLVARAQAHEHTKEKLEVFLNAARRVEKLEQLL